MNTKKAVHHIQVFLATTILANVIKITLQKYSVISDTA